MEKTWRWFGRKDRITPGMLRQIGVEGIVTALHDVPNGEVWTPGAIADTKDIIAAHGLRWSVVESLPVSEGIKYGSPERDRLIDNYILSLENLGRAGIATVCYNFMPVIDWIRTDLRHPLPDGTFTLHFDRIRFAYFDCAILGREGAEKDYTPSEMALVRELEATTTPEQRDELIDTIIVKTQGFISGNIGGGEKDPVALFRRLLENYKGIDAEGLRANLKYFLEAVVPVAEKWGIGLCIHPDDPPRAVLGLPRIVTCEEDIRWILSAVDSPSNGLTFCAGSLSSGAHNDVVRMAREFAPRTRFVHLRSTQVQPGGDFTEASHLEGRGELVELVRIFQKTDTNLPMRVDHGKLMLDDVDKGDNPGYSFLGRMYALAQVSGIMAVVDNEVKNKMI
jgi:mannonate dehydratase